MITKFKVFFSHKTSDTARVDELQEHLRELLPNFPIEDVSKKVPYADNWKPLTLPILQSCEMLVCIIGKDTYNSEPIDWEIREAHQLNKPMIVTTLEKTNKLPQACHDLRIECQIWNATEIAGQMGEMLLPRALFLGHDWATGSPRSADISQQYDLMVQSWESLIERRQTVNTVYITINSVLLAGVGVLLSITDKIGSGWTAAAVTVMAFLGAALSYNWRRTIISYGILSKAKSKVVAALENYMPAQLFDAEWRVLEAKRYKSTTATDQQTALFFILLYSSIFLVSGGITIGQFV